MVFTSLTFLVFYIIVFARHRILSLKAVVQNLLDGIGTGFAVLRQA